MKKVLLVASGLSANQFYDYDYKTNGWTIIAVNNGWLACKNEWDLWIKSNDYDGEKALPNKNQIQIKEYGSALREYGGQKACGYSITLNAGYWALANLKPDVIGFLGADMNYVPDENGNTHIYGKGNDIKKNGIPDPDRMVLKHGNGKKNYLNDIYMRLEKYAGDQNCKLYNLSHTIDTRLPYKRVFPNVL
jgi:hypothetical protein